MTSRYPWSPAFLRTKIMEAEARRDQAEREIAFFSKELERSLEKE